MAQRAQEEPIVIKCGWLENPDNISEEVKTKLRKCFLRGTIMDVQLECDSDEVITKEVVRMLSYQITYKDSENKIPHYLVVGVFSVLGEVPVIIECGEFQSSDYEDNVPLDE